MDENTSMGLLEFRRREPKCGLTEDPREDGAQCKAHQQGLFLCRVGVRGQQKQRSFILEFTLQVLGSLCWAQADIAK